MANSNNLNIGLIEQSQAQKYVTINEAIAALEAVQNRGVEDQDLAAPPGSPSEGDAYIVAASATGDWAGKEKNIAYYNSAEWKFISPNEGLMVWVNDEDKLCYFDGTDWQEFTSGGGGSETAAKFGINATADTTNKLSVASDAVLFSHDGTDIRAKLNKNSSTDTASFLFQDNFSGRAEFGLVGNDDFTLKVSSDGSTWNDALSVDRTTGKVNIDQAINFGQDDLDYYEEGTWTPVLAGTSTAGSHSYSIQFGRYTRIGNLYIAQFLVTLTSKDTSMSGSSYISLPATIASAAGNRPTMSNGLCTNLSLTTNNVLGSYGVQNTNRMYLFEYGDNGYTGILSGHSWAANNTSINGVVAFSVD